MGHNYGFNLPALSAARRSAIWAGRQRCPIRIQSFYLCPELGGDFGKTVPNTLMVTTSTFLRGNKVDDGSSMPPVPAPKMTTVFSVLKVFELLMLPLRKVLNLPRWLIIGWLKARAPEAEPQWDLEAVNTVFPGT